MTPFLDDSAGNYRAISIPRHADLSAATGRAGVVVEFVNVPCAEELDGMRRLYRLLCCAVEEVVETHVLVFGHVG
jgi:hypothetical protein